MQVQKKGLTPNHLELISNLLGHVDKGSETTMSWKEAFQRFSFGFMFLL